MATLKSHGNEVARITTVFPQEDHDGEIVQTTTERAVMSDGTILQKNTLKRNGDRRSYSSSWRVWGKLPARLIGNVGSVKEALKDYAEESAHSGSQVEITWQSENWPYTLRDRARMRNGGLA